MTEDGTAAPDPESRAAAESPAAWGFPGFARAFPKHAELDALVEAFAQGNYARVREGAPKLIAATDDPAVKRAATTLRERIEPDPTAKILFVLAAALLTFLTAWWIAHDGPEGARTKPVQLVPKVEHVD